jgi:L-lactate dehydrogenase complex protein LldF
MLRKWRERDFERGNPPLVQRLALKLWALAAKRPRLYHRLAGTVMPLMARLGRKRGSFHWLPFARAWTGTRDFPAPEGKTFQQLYAKRERSLGR